MEIEVLEYICSQDASLSEKEISYNMGMEQDLVSRALDYLHPNGYVDLKSETIKEENENKATFDFRHSYERTPKGLEKLKQYHLDNPK